MLALVESARAVQITLGAAAALLLETFARIYNKVFGRGDAHPRAARVVQEAKGRWQSSTADMPHVSNLYSLLIHNRYRPEFAR